MPKDLAGPESNIFEQISRAHASVMSPEMNRARKDADEFIDELDFNNAVDLRKEIGQRIQELGTTGSMDEILELSEQLKEVDQIINRWNQQEASPDREM